MLGRSLLVAIVFLTAVNAYAINSPQVSANSLFLYRHSNFAEGDLDTTRNGVDLREAELAFYADVDPYSRLFLLLSVHPEYKLNSTSTAVEESWVVEPEEAFAESNVLSGVTLRFGKFKAAFGKHNLLHTHAYPFVEAPVAQTDLLGDEGLNDAGVSAAYLVPLPWYFEVTGQYLRGEGENEEFNSPSPNDGVGVLHLKNLWDLSDNSTLEWGISGASGGNSLGGTTSLYGSDVTWKWRPVEGGKYHSWILAGEYIHRDLEQPGSLAARGTGFNIWSQFQWAERWKTSLRYDSMDMKNSTSVRNGLTDKKTVGLTFQATEFSSFQAEFSQAKGPISTTGNNTENKVFLQANFTIGAHPAHSY